MKFTAFPIFCANSTTFRGWWIFNLHLSSLWHFELHIFIFTAVPHHTCWGQKSHAPPLAHTHNPPAPVVCLSRQPDRNCSNTNISLPLARNHLFDLRTPDITVKDSRSPEYLEANPVDMVLDEEEELLGDAKDPGRLVPREEPAVPLVPKIQLHLNLSFDKKLSSSYLIILSGRSYLTS